MPNRFFGTLFNTAENTPDEPVQAQQQVTSVNQLTGTVTVGSIQDTNNNPYHWDMVENYRAAYIQQMMNSGIDNLSLNMLKGLYSPKKRKGKAFLPKWF